MAEQLRELFDKKLASFGSMLSLFFLTLSLSLSLLSCSRSLRNKRSLFSLFPSLSTIVTIVSVLRCEGLTCKGLAGVVAALQRDLQAALAWKMEGTKAAFEAAFEDVREQERIEGHIKAEMEGIRQQVTFLHSSLAQV